MTMTMEKPNQNIPTVYAHFRDKEGKKVSAARTVYGATPEEAAEIFQNAVKEKTAKTTEAAGNGKD